MGSLVSVNLAHVRVDAWTGRVGRSGIDKRPVTHPVALRDDAVDGDTICNRKVHGRPDQAVYAYAREDAAFWTSEIGRPVADGALGENLTTEGVEVTEALIGECWAIGTARLQVAGPRVPCSTFAGFWDVPKLVKRFTLACRPGAYLRILTPGVVQVGQAIEVLDRPEGGVTLAEAFRAITGDRAAAQRVLAAPGVGGLLRAELTR